MTKFNNQKLISNYPNCICINSKLNSNKPILCFKSGMHQTEAEGQKPVSGIMQLVKMKKGITRKGITRKGITRKGVTRKGITQKGITRKGITQIGITQKA